MKRIWILSRQTGQYEDRQVTDIAAFISKVGAEAAMRRVKEWFAEHPRPDFDAVWSDELVAFDPARLAPYRCPYDPEHMDDHTLEVPSYGVHPLDIMLCREFLNYEQLACQRADREMR